MHRVRALSHWLFLPSLLAPASLVVLGCNLVFEPKPSTNSGSTGDAAATTGTDVDTAGGTADTGSATGGACPAAVPCTYNGICVGKVTPICKSDGTWDCRLETLSEVPGYEATETQCDGFDNDCDGTIDEELRRESDPQCTPGGVCGTGRPSRCVASKWECTTDPKISTYEPIESLCDGKDNDCDGKTDEDLVGRPEQCQAGVLPGVKNIGVCALIDVRCEAATWTCSQVLPYEVSETLCDGLDNDCNGTADDIDAAAAKKHCPSVGACTNPNATGAPKCIAGPGVVPHWDCAAFYASQASPELCDGKDNDCNGLTDDGSSVLAPSQCPASVVTQNSQGVCAAAMSVVCSAAGAVCGFDAVPSYEPVELSCDGKDNDCDGETDETLAAAPAGTCKSAGECALGSKAGCSGGNWSCTYQSVAWEAVEATCDGKDNDCDGQTDEGLPGDTTLCAQAGVCLGAAVGTTCVAGKTVCDYSLIPGWEPKEESCDDKDNDCDGKVDNIVQLNLAKTGCRVAGQCTSKTVTASCATATAPHQWKCDYSNVSGYQAEPESKCDGKDNDCDGLIDEGIVDPGGGSCPTTGVCEGTVTAICVGAGSFVCKFDAVDGYQSPEASCDGRDNDCDGETDEGVCPLLAPCEKDGQCVSAKCKPEPGGARKFCVSDGAQCPTTDGKSQVAKNAVACHSIESPGAQTKSYVVACGTTDWSQQADCGEQLCVEGTCKKCVPGAIICQNDGQATLTCRPDGLDYDSAPCPVSTKATTCVQGGHGVCLNYADILISDATGTHEAPNVAVGASGRMAVTWQAKKGTPTSYAIGRTFDELAIEAATTLPAASGKESILPDVVIIDATEAIVAWQEVDKVASDTGNIRLRRLNHATNAYLTGAAGTPQTPHAQTKFEQGSPRLATRFGGGIVAVWQSQAAAGGNGFDIYARPYATGLSPISGSPDKIINSYVDGDQLRPAVQSLPNGNVLIAWEDASQDIGTYGVYARVMTPILAVVSDAFQLNATSVGDQRDVQIASRTDAGFVAVWTSTQNNGSADVFVRAFDNDGDPDTGEVLVSAGPNGLPKENNQQHADVATFADGTVVVVYDDAAGDTSGAGVLWRRFDSKLAPLGPAQLVNVGIITGDQLNPRIGANKTIASGQPWFFVVYQSVEGGAANTQVYGRPFELK